MPLLVTSLLPHSPLLIPEIGKSNQEFLTKNIEAYKKISQEIKEKEVETIIVVTPHASLDKDVITINVAPEMEIDFKEFGFITERLSINGDSILADKINSKLKESISVNIVSEPLLDYGSAVPAFIFQKDNPNLKIVVIATADNLSNEIHAEAGKLIKDILKENNKKIALIASGDMSHSLKKKSPAKYNPKANKFDNRIIEILSKNDNVLENILAIDSKQAEEVNQCALKPLSFMLGVLQNNFTTTQLAYETEFGVGYLSYNFVINNNIN